MFSYLILFSVSAYRSKMLGKTCKAVRAGNKLIKNLKMKDVFKVKMKYVIMAAVVVSVAMFVSGCKSKKLPSVQEGSRELSVPLSGKEYRSDKDYFRATGIGVSTDLAAAKKIAQQNARTTLATNISSTMKAVSENYIQDRQINDRDEFGSKFEEISRTVVNQTLNDVREMDEKVFQEKDGRYRYYVALEMSKEPVIRNLNQGISKEAKMQQDFDQYRFRQILDEEMKKFENQ